MIKVPFTLLEGRHFTGLELQPQTRFSAGIDVTYQPDPKDDECLEVLRMQKNRVYLVPTGIRLDMQNAMYYPQGKDEGINVNILGRLHAKLLIRSSLSLKGLRMSNGVGLIDNDYMDEVKLPMYWSGITMDEDEMPGPFEIARGTRIGQLSFELQFTAMMVEVQTLGTSLSDRAGGFGSTDA